MEEIIKILKDCNMSLQNIYNSYGDDDTDLIYSKNGIEIYYCQDYGYIDIIGLTTDQWRELRKLMGEKDHLEFTDNQIQRVIPALNYHRDQKIQDRIKYPLRPRFDFTKDDVATIPLLINKLKANQLTNITSEEVYILDTAVVDYSCYSFNCDSEERKSYDKIHNILNNYKSYLREYEL